MPIVDARDDFLRARRAHLRARAIRLLRGRRRRPNHPRALPEIARRSGRVPRLDVIALDCIVGTVDASPHFDERFRPASEHLRRRWERVALARRMGLALPPIEVLCEHDGYYVVDGRHRISVARAAGERDIEAWVR
jgi:hypothetical protein